MTTTGFRTNIDANTISPNDRVFSGLTSTLIGVWTDTATPPTTSELWYQIKSTVGDTTSIEQAENEVNAIESEYTSDPLYEKVTSGEKTFSCELINLDQQTLAGILGWEKDDNNNLVAPKNAVTKYATIELHFESTKDVIVLPKVRLNSTITLASLKTDAGRVTISGTCYSTTVNIGTGDPSGTDVEKETDMFILKEGSSYLFATPTAGAGE